MIPLISKDIIDYGLMENNKETVITLSLIMFGICLFDNFINIFKENQRIKICNKLKYKLWHNSFNHLMKMEIKYFDKTNYGELLSRLNRDIDSIGSIVDENLIFVFTQVFSMLGGIIGLCIISVKLTLIEEYKSKEFSIKKESVLKNEKAISLLREYNSASDKIIVNLLLTSIYILGSNMVFNMQLTVGSIFSFITYTNYVIEPISAVLNIKFFLSGIIPSSKRYYEFIEASEEKDEIEDSSFNTLEDGDIEFKNVYFSYSSDNYIRLLKKTIYQSL